MRHARERISDDTWTAYAQARALRTVDGAWPSAKRLARLGGDPWALIVLTRGELPSRDDPRLLVPTFDKDAHLLCERPDLVVPTLETLWAICLDEAQVYAWLYDVWDRKIDTRDMWREAQRRGALPGILTLPPIIQVELPA